MKISKIVCFSTLFILIFFFVYQSAEKENIYISFEELAGYSYQFSDSNDVLRTKKVVIKQSGKMYYQWWEVEIDSTRIKKSDLKDVENMIINSQYWIINNSQRPEMDKSIIKKYRLFILKRENEVQYILPVKSVAYIVE